MTRAEHTIRKEVDANPVSTNGAEDGLARLPMMEAGIGVGTGSASSDDIWALEV
jgi:hypothetical protein